MKYFQIVFEIRFTADEYCNMYLALRVPQKITRHLAAHTCVFLTESIPV
jgi:hypothetical protein